MIDTSYFDQRIDDLFDEIHAVRVERAEAKRAEFPTRTSPTPSRYVPAPRTVEDTLAVLRGAWQAYTRMGRPKRAQAVQRRAERLKAARPPHQAA